MAEWSISVITTALRTGGRFRASGARRLGASVLDLNRRVDSSARCARNSASDTRQVGHDAQKAGWRSPSDIKRVYANESIVGENRVVFNIKGNTYRLVVAMNYPHRLCYIRFIGSHEAYDRIDVTIV